MCIAIPGKVLSVNGDKAEVDFNGIKKQTSSEFVHVKKGDYVLVFGENILEVIDEKRAKEILKLLSA